jgi:AcrR family transcriptional regulator
MEDRPPRVKLAEVVRELPRRPHDLSRRTISQSQRWRLLEAMTEAVAERGYAQASVADAIALAGVSRKTFYELFADKEDCFLAAFEALSERLLALVVAAGETQPRGSARRRAFLARFLHGLANDPLGARVFLIDAAGAGPAAQHMRQRLHARFAAAFLGDVVSGVPRVAIAGGIRSVVIEVLLDHGAGALPALLDELAAFVERALSQAGSR